MMRRPGQNWVKKVSRDVGKVQLVAGKNVYAWISQAMAFEPGSRATASSILQNWKLR
jgi:hypothetical protein